MSSLEVRNDATDAAEATGPTPTLAAGFASLAAFVEKSHACAHPQARCRLWLRHLCERFAAPLAVLRWTAARNRQQRKRLLGTQLPTAFLFLAIALVSHA